MPELPEVEVTRRTIAPGLEGAVVTAARLGKALRWPLGCAPEHLAHRAVGQAQRRGKYIWLPLGPGRGGEAEGGGLLLHLGMSGSLSLSAEPGPAGVHDHFDLVTTRGTLRLHDPRRFGAVVWSAGMDHPPAAQLLAGLGPEPFDPALDAPSFHARLRTRRAPIKAVLLSGQAVVGAGNIYACEALFAAGIDPRLPACRLSRPRAARLLEAVRGTLARALELGGSTLRDFRDAHGMDGAYQQHAAVYGREGQPCPRCQAPVRRILQGQRATYFCRACQRR
ncbi:MAG: formamidopyrimidine-DNA glycosylase/DNA-(apurinic or apyrimidinic site) lyase MutM [Pseudomonadota bacterium]|jgi:formamidopyrimidine-DNA glycosylase